MDKTFNNDVNIDNDIYHYHNYFNYCFIRDIIITTIIVVIVSSSSSSSCGKSIIIVIFIIIIIIITNLIINILFLLLLVSCFYIWVLSILTLTHLAFFINLQRAVLGPSATLTGR